MGFRSVLAALAVFPLVGVPQGGTGGARLALPSGWSYVVPPTRISPDVGSFGQVPPIFREPTLLVTDTGIVTAFMEIPPDDSAARKGWTCRSDDGTGWECGKVTIGDGLPDWADPWLADTRGDPCPTYGSGVTLVALRSGGAQRPLEPIAYHSTDAGRTWSQPTLVPFPQNLRLMADGSKVAFNGRTYFGFRDFTFATGGYVSRLGTDSDACAWSEPVRLFDVHDHIRLSPAETPDGVAVRANLFGTALTFHEYDKNFQEVASSVIGATPAATLLQTCTSDGTCTTAWDLGQTLLYDPKHRSYHAVYPAYDPSGPTAITVYYVRSDDGGSSWSPPLAVAGAGALGSDPGAAAMESMLAWDETRGRLLLAYYEKPTANDLTVALRIRVLGDDGQWAEPVTVDTTPYVPGYGGTQRNRFGDYFGFDARDGVAHIAHHAIDERGVMQIRYVSVCYAPSAQACSAP